MLLYQTSIAPGLPDCAPLSQHTDSISPGLPACVQVLQLMPSTSCDVVPLDFTMDARRPSSQMNGFCSGDLLFLGEPVAGLS